MLSFPTDFLLRKGLMSSLVSPSMTRISHAANLSDVNREMAISPYSETSDIVFIPHSAKRVAVFGPISSGSVRCIPPGLFSSLPILARILVEPIPKDVERPSLSIISDCRFFVRARAVSQLFSQISVTSR